MNSQHVGLRVAGVIFGLMALVQLARLFFRPEIMIDGHAIPLWPSAVALAVLGGLAIWMLRLARSSAV